jgi:hypothetical protein
MFLLVDGSIVADFSVIDADISDVVDEVSDMRTGAAPTEGR